MKNVADATVLEQPVSISVPDDALKEVNDSELEQAFFISGADNAL